MSPPTTNHAEGLLVTGPGHRKFLEDSSNEQWVINTPSIESPAPHKETGAHKAKETRKADASDAALPIVVPTPREYQMQETGLQPSLSNLQSAASSIDLSPVVSIDMVEQRLDELTLRLVTSMKELLEQTVSLEVMEIRGMLQNAATDVATQLKEDGRHTPKVRGAGIASRIEAPQRPDDDTIPIEDEDDAIAEKVSIKQGESSSQISKLISRFELGTRIQINKDDVMQRFVTTGWFNIGVFVVIVAQSMILGVEADFQIRAQIERLEGSRQEANVHWYISMWSFIFHGFFFVEMVVRLIAWKWKFFSRADTEFFYWNMFDIFLCFTSVLEFIDVKTDVMRAFRLLRVARVLRLLRLFEKLRKMIYALLHSLNSLLWLMFMLWTTLYMFALAFMQGVFRFVEDMTPSEFQNVEPSEFDEESQFTWIVVNRFGGMGTTMRTLFATLTGGEGWDFLFGPIMSHSWWYTFVAIFFIIFFVFGVLNVVTGVFVEEAMKISQLDKEILISDAVAADKELQEDIKQLVDRVDADNDGILTHRELQKMVFDNKCQRWLAGCDIDLNSQNLGTVIQMLDVENTGKIDPDNFFDLLTKLRGQARSIDLFLLANEIKLEQQRLCRSWKTESNEQITMLQKQVAQSMQWTRALNQRTATLSNM